MILASFVVAIPVVIMAQGWEQQAAQERTSFRIGALDAFDSGDYPSAVQGLTVMAEEGSAIAQARLAYLFENGLAVDRDVVVAKRWYRAAAAQGDDDAKLSLARLLEREENASHRALALSLFEELATSGSAEAALRLAVGHFEGLGTQQDYVAAARWLSRAAKAGNPEAQLRLGLLYRDGLGVPQDIVFAHMWLNLAAARFPAAERHRRNEAIEARDALAQTMRREELRESLQMAREWQSVNS